MRKKFSLIKLADRIDKILDTVLSVYIIVILSLFIDLALFDFLKTALSAGEAAGSQFFWTMIFSCFGLVGVFSTVKKEMKSSSQKKLVPTISFLFILAGTTLLIGLGVMSLGITKNAEWTKFIAAGIGFIGLSMMSVGFSAMFLESAKSVVSVWSKK